MTRAPIVFPSLKGSNRKLPEDSFLAPISVTGMDGDDLFQLGQAFRPAMIQEKDRERLLNRGIVSEDRTIVAVICDIKKSTPLLRRVGFRRFQEFQNNFHGRSLDLIRTVNKSQYESAPETCLPRAVMDKFTGDGCLFYVDCGETVCPSNHDYPSLEDRQRTGVQLALGLIRDIIDGLVDWVNDKRDIIGDQAPGLRFGVALGDRVMLSVIGFQRDAKSGRCVSAGDFTLTGAVVNMAARLEHATVNDFLAAVDQDRSSLQQYLGRLGDVESTRSTPLGERALTLDRQVVELYASSRKRFEIRADERFCEVADQNTETRDLAWQVLPFEPVGFFGRRTVRLLAGDSTAELFTRV